MKAMFCFGGSGARMMSGERRPTSLGLSAIASILFPEAAEETRRNSYE
jgi:hypothetical protein